VISDRDTVTVRGVNLSGVDIHTCEIPRGNPLERSVYILRTEGQDVKQVLSGGGEQRG
jgi:hypothetical protein